jgi:hypothetical protein
VVAVTGAVNAVTGVTWGRDPALDVTGTVPAVIAEAGCHPPSRRADGLGQVLLATLGSLAQATLACATEIATAMHDTRRYARPSRYPLYCRSRRWSRASPDPPRSRLLSKMSQGRNSSAAGQKLPRRHGATCGRFVPWWQRLVIIITRPIASTAQLRSEPDGQQGEFELGIDT